MKILPVRQRGNNSSGAVYSDVKRSFTMIENALFIYVESKKVGQSQYKKHTTKMKQTHDETIKVRGVWRGDDGKETDV